MIAPPVLAFLGTLIGVTLLLSGRLPLNVPDLPNARSLHTRITPRSGGLAIMAGIVLAWSAIPGSDWVLLAMAGMVFTSSFWDDVRGLSIKWRLLSHFLAAGLILYFASPGLHAWWMLVILLFGIVWSSNLFNFMDGADGMAGGMALSGFLFYGLAALGQDNVPIALESLSIATASLAFLLFNFQPARIFMGDAGAIPLGFLAASLGLHGWAQHAWPSWFPLLVFLPFIADSTVTLIKRLTKGESLLEAHRSHYYQRLILMGWSHRKLALWAYGLMIVAGISATIGLTLSLQNLLGTFIFWFCLIGLIMICIDRKWQRFAKTHNQAVVTDFFQHKPESIE